ncbi:MAG TPA: hypothetical protein VKU89_04935 [Solirubrobacteraceae bacterium]|nr:hypothetical protein [Solirubrobacteraceae bacterium]
MDPSGRPRAAERRADQAAAAPLEVAAESLLPAPDLSGIIRAANAARLPFVVIGGFSVIANGFVRATEDCDLLVPDGPESDRAILRFLRRSGAVRSYDGRPLSLDEIAAADTLRVRSRYGIIDIIRGGLPPLDFQTVSERAMRLELDGQRVRVASLASVVGFKRLAGRPRDRLDLMELEALHGKLPSEPIAGVDEGRS